MHKGSKATVAVSGGCAGGSKTTVPVLKNARGVVNFKTIPCQGQRGAQGGEGYRASVKGVRWGLETTVPVSKNTKT